MSAAPAHDTVGSAAAGPHSWFLAVLLLGGAIRLFLAIATPGTLDVDVWKLHTLALEKQGLISYYQGGSLQFNHPPPAAWLISALGHVSTETGIRFGVLLRLPFALVDLASVWLILRLLAGSPHARWIASAFWLHPIAIVFSSYHGNTDSAIACFLLATTLMVSRGQGLLAGAILGLSFWIKIPGVLAGPIFLFALKDAKQRRHFCLAAGLVGFAGFAPALLTNPRAVIDAVFLYPGLTIRTGSGTTIWGFFNLAPGVETLPQSMRLWFVDLQRFVARYNSVICIGPLLVFAWLRRGRSGVEELATSLAGGFALFYGLTSFWAFQYLAWSLPFWLLAPRWFAVSASLVATLYIYGAYAWLCGDMLLLGTWDFIGKPDWPGWLIAARNIANLFFLFAGFAFLIQAAKEARSAK